MHSTHTHCAYCVRLHCLFAFSWLFIVIGFVDDILHIPYVIYYSRNCFGLLFFFRVCAFFWLDYAFVLFIFLLLFFVFIFSCLLSANVFSRYAMQLRLLYTKPKTNPNRQCLIHSTHFVHPSSLNSVKLHDLLNLWIIHLKQIRNEISFFLSLSISRCWLDGYFFYLNSIAKNRLKTNRNSILGGKKPRKMISIHCSLQRPHICLIFVNLRLHA